MSNNQNKKKPKYLREWRRNRELNTALQDDISSDSDEIHRNPGNY